MERSFSQRLTQAIAPLQSEVAALKATAARQQQQIGQLVALLQAKTKR